MSTGTDRTQESGEVSERAARAVAEAARETEWTRPSFAKGLYLGRFDPDLIHPLRVPTPEEQAAGEAFMARLEEYCRTMAGRPIERDARIPDDYLAGPGRTRHLRHEDLRSNTAAWA